MRNLTKFGVLIALEGIAEARAEWHAAKRKFDADVNFLMHRLLLEAARNRMSVDEVAKASGYSVAQVRAMMRKRSLDPKKGRTLLAKQAAEALAANAELMGIQPWEMDLTSPLAYLPMGDEMRRALETKNIEIEQDDL